MKISPKSLLMALLLAMGLALSGCGGKEAPRKSQASMDTPKFHNLQGDKLLKQGDYHKAKSSYGKALELDSANSHAQSGLLVALAHLTERKEVSDETKSKILKDGEELIEKALDNARNDGEKAVAHHHAVRFYVVLGLPSDWYDKAKDHYEDAVEMDPGHVDAYFFMAQAEAKRRNLDRAKALYSKVIGLKGLFAMEADRELARIQKIERAMPGSDFAVDLGQQAELSRADAAALLVAELGLDRLYKREPAPVRSGYAPPGKEKIQVLAPAQTMPDATDIDSHPLKASIETVIKLGLKGLEADAAHKFHPSSALSRAEFALMIQDILIRITKDEGLATKYVGTESPYADVPSDRWFYNAVRTTVTRGLMQVDPVTGRFSPQGTISGADALMAIRSLKAVIERQ